MAFFGNKGYKKTKKPEVPAFFRLSGNEHLRPIVALCPSGSIADADFRIIWIEDVSPVAFTVHPGLDDLLGRRLSRCYIFSSCSVGNAKIFYHRKR